jgi:hypothetical protein
MHWMSPRQQAVEVRRPVELELLVGQLLSCPGIGQLQEAVVGPEISQFGLIHLAGQHRTAVEADVDRKRIPALDSDVTPAEDGVLKIVVKVQALAVLVNWFQPLGLMVGANRHGGAGLDGSQYGDESLLEAIVLGDPFDLLLFIEVGRTAADIVIGPLLVGRSSPGLFPDLVTDLLRMFGKIFEQDFG